MMEVEDVAVAMVEFQSGARGVIQASTACYSNQTARFHSYLWRSGLDYDGGR